MEAEYTTDTTAGLAGLCVKEYNYDVLPDWQVFNTVGWAVHDTIERVSEGAA